MNNFNWKKILLKISGESLMGEDPYGINPTVVKSFANEIEEVVIEDDVDIDESEPSSNQATLF